MSEMNLRVRELSGKLVNLLDEYPDVCYETKRFILSDILSSVTRFSDSEIREYIASINQNREDSNE